MHLRIEYFCYLYSINITVKLINSRVFGQINYIIERKKYIL